ncbi:hypothetical protein AKG11_31970 [Shinella sp. SUS2]|uniref:hypothetical protein n=1 Tax=unclassified Shinella TaxID=2643062 RepID=UPI00067FB163|nr:MULTISPECIES: hypothetical protein [unclassified Shinella]KNY12942.1 hypothetical protein AKG11_31970 [Shinella sp. SUS2]KOC71681.1 hypothetical protein AKG10_31620 [Shinella sp. GWS1]
MSKLLNKLLGKSSSADIAAAITKAQAELAQAEAAVAAAEEQYEANLLTADKKALRALLDAKTEANIDLDQARARAHRLERDHEAALEAEAESNRQAAYDRAKELTATARKKLGDYEKAAMAIRDVLRAIAEADVAVELANESLPAGAARLEKAEDVRSAPNLYKEVTKEETVELWAAIGQQSVPLEHQHRVRVERVGKRIRSRWSEEDFDEGGWEKGYYSTDNGGTIEAVKRRFIKRTFLPDETGHFAAPLAQKVELPPAIVGGPVFFEPGSYHAAGLLAKLDQPLPPRRVRPERKAEIEYVLAPRETALAS